MKTKTQIPNSKKILAWTSFTTGALLAGVAMAQPTPPPPPQAQTHNVIVASGGSEDDDAAPAAAGTGSSGGTGSGRSFIRIQSVEPSQSKKPAREVTWMGVSTEDASEAIASQLGLKPGQGLVVVFVAPDSPAAKAGIQKYDVIEEFGDQVLVDPTQFRKLVQMQKEGDSVKLTLYRGGKKQTVPITLAKRMENFGMMSPVPGQVWELPELARADAHSIQRIHGSQIAPAAVAYVDKKMVNAEVERNMEEARAAIQDALRQSAQAGHMARSATAAATLASLSPMVDFGNNATVTVTKDGNSVKTFVKSDDSGVIVIVANPKKRLTAHDADGKLVFDGEIETPEQQQKVPQALWEKVKPLLEEDKLAPDTEPEPHAESEGRPKL